MAMSADEIKKEFGITPEQLGQWEADAAAGILHGEPSGPVTYGPGRPLMFDEEMKQVGFKEPVNKILLIDIRAAQLGMKRSEYLRVAVSVAMGLGSVSIESLSPEGSRPDGRACLLS